MFLELLAECNLADWLVSHWRLGNLNCLECSYVITARLYSLPWRKKSFIVSEVNGINFTLNFFKQCCFPAISLFWVSSFASLEICGTFTVSSK